MSPKKEPWYFSIGARTKPFQGPKDAYYNLYLTRTEYEDLFCGVIGEKVIGEASTDYLYSERAFDSLRREFPAAKLVAILRNPAERAYSQYIQHVAQAREPCRNFWEAIEAEDERQQEEWCHYWFYRSLGFYGRQLRRYYEGFNAAQIKVFLLDDLRSDPARVYRELFKFLEVDETFLPVDTKEKHNANLLPRNRYLLDLLSRPSVARSILRWTTPRQLRDLVRPRIVATKKRVKPPELKPVDRQRLIEGYREDIALLESLIGRNLSSWLVCPGEKEMERQSV